MATTVGNIAASAFPNRRINILAAPVHERAQSSLKNVDATFYLVHCPNGKTWDVAYAPLPKNHILIPKEKGIYVPPDVDIDLVISGNKFDNFQTLAPIAKAMGVPLISVEHTAPMKGWTKEYIEQIKQMRGEANVFITEWSREQWGWKSGEATVIPHGIDTHSFNVSWEIPKQRFILSVVNQFRERGDILGFDIWKEVVSGLPHKHLGFDPGFSEPAKDIADLVKHHHASKIFLNTSIVSPIPMSLLEAMSCGSAVVSTATCEIPNIIEHGKNGLISNDPKELRHFCEALLKNPAFVLELGMNARRTIMQRFGLDKCAERWNNLIRAICLK